MYGYTDEFIESVINKYNKITELTKEIERLNKNLKQGIEYCKELMLFKKNSRQYLIGKSMLEKLGGSDKE